MRNLSCINYTLTLVPNLFATATVNVSNYTQPCFSFFGVRANERELLSGDRGAFQNGSARTRSDADAAHMRKRRGEYAH